MKQHLEDETELRRYLLGELTLKERVLIEERLFLDDDYLLRVKAVEDDLIDDYVYDELTASEREKFETHFLDKPGGRDDLRIAKALKHYIASETEAAESAAPDPAPGTFLSAANAGDIAAQPPAKKRGSFFAWLFGRRPVVGFSFAAAVALIILPVIVWYATDSATRQERERQLQAQDSTPRPTQPVERGHSPSPVNSPVNAGDNGEASETAKQQDTKRGGTEEDAKRVAEQSRRQTGRTGDKSPPPRQSQTRQTPTRVVAFLLLPGGVARGGGASNNVQISADVGTVILRLPLAGRDDYKTYRATLQTGGRTTRTWAGLKPETHAEFGQIVAVKVPATLLRQQNYQIKLSGLTATGQVRNLTSHAFQVERK